jgi:hypothetical protein
MRTTVSHTSHSFSHLTHAYNSFSHFTQFLTLDTCVQQFLLCALACVCILTHTGCRPGAVDRHQLCVHPYPALRASLPTQAADLVLWIGISFEQSASVEYFRRVRSILASQGRLEQVQQVLGVGGGRKGGV